MYSRRSPRAAHINAAIILFLITALAPTTSGAQESTLTIDRIMQDPDTWIGAWPSQPFWHESGDTLYFRWNPNGAFESDSLFRVDPFTPDAKPAKLTPRERRNLGPAFSGWHHGEHIYDSGFDRKVYEREGDIYVFDRRSNASHRLTKTVEREFDPRFRADGSGVVFTRGVNLWAIDERGTTIQLTDLRTGEAEEEPQPTTQAEFLREQQEALLEVIRERRRDEDAQEAHQKREAAAEEWPATFYVGERDVEQLQLDPSERFTTFVLAKTVQDSPTTIVPKFVTETGYVETESARPKVGFPTRTHELYVQDARSDSTYRVDLSHIIAADTTERLFYAYGPHWNGDGTHAVLEVRPWDNKDRWIAELLPETAKLRVLDHQHDEAWLQAPGISAQGGRSTMGWLPDGRTFYFQSERTGRSHIFTADLGTGNVRQLTDGDFDVYDPMISRDGRFWFFASNEHSAFERHFYRMPINGGPRTRLTEMRGRNDVELSPTEEALAILHSYTNRPPEIYVQRPTAQGAQPRRITRSVTQEWASYEWRDPEIITFEASDGVEVPAQMFMPAQPNGSAVLFVHGAGYLQNVHSWWSSYFREYMFHNLLTDLGYIVMNVDYRGSSGYGREWRTSVYRHMGGRDLQDYVDASRFLADEHGIDPERTFIYGGSYGGFITMMALFTEPEHFGGGAALRSVTDWAHYHHGYTANILNTPMEDSLAFARSSPIYFAEGLEDPLLIAHGMVDDNVHFQDVVRLAQRLIELGKEDWEMAVYPIEAHGFTEPASWADEYRRILKYIRLSVGPPEAAREEVPVLRTR